MAADSPRVLVVEDDPDLIWLMSSALESAGYRVVQAYGGEDALRKVKLHKPDLIVTDLAMPKMSGVELILQVKGNPETQDTPCVAVTAFTWDHIAGSAKAAGCDGFIAKPFNAARLLEQVARYVPAPKQPRPAASKRG